jgi:hypothetical protein
MNKLEVGEFADRYITAVEAGNAALVRSFYDPQARIWHNTDNVEKTVDEAMRTVEWLGQTLQQQKCTVIRREVLKDGFFQQDILRATLPDGTPFVLSACMVVKIENGLIVRVDEYLDSAELAPLRDFRP